MATLARALPRQGNLPQQCHQWHLCDRESSCKTRPEMVTRAPTQEEGLMPCARTCDALAQWPFPQHQFFLNDLESAKLPYGNFTAIFMLYVVFHFTTEQELVDEFKKLFDALQDLGISIIPINRIL